VFVINAPITLGAYAWAEAHGADCSIQSDLFIACTSQNGGYGRGGTTVGNVFMTGQKRDEVSEALLRHEKRHSVQWAGLGLKLPIYYYANEVVGWILPGPSYCWNVFEWQAGFKEGNYPCAGLGRLTTQKEP